MQYRDKTSDTGVLVETARKLHSLTQAYGVPLVINDRVDVAVAVGCEGVHLGQDDMSEFATYYIILGDLTPQLQNSRKPNDSSRKMPLSVSVFLHLRKPRRLLPMELTTWALGRCSPHQRKSAESHSYEHMILTILQQE